MRNSNDAIDDGHSKCTYFSCNGPVLTPCPFLKAEPDPVEPKACKHEWRQLIDENAQFHQFYCIHCRQIEN